MRDYVFLSMESKGIWDIAVLIAVFILILVATYYASKFIGSMGNQLQRNSNIKVLEVFRLNQTKYIYIVKLADKIVALGVTKDHIEYLTELKEENMNLTIPEEKQTISFRELLQKNIKER